MEKLPLSKDANGIPYIANTDNDGNLAIPTEQYILSNGVYVPVSTSNPLPTDATLQGSDVELATGDYNQILNVSASGATIVTITPPVGELWRINGLYLNIPGPTGATSGYHYLICLGIGTDAIKNSKLRLESNYGNVMTVRYNTFQSATKTQIPSTETAQIDAITRLVVTNANPLSFYYGNLTDVAQTGTFEITVDREVEHIV